MILARKYAQRAQDAQTGYCSDYCAKNQPMGFHEIKEFQKGHVALHATLAHEGLNVIGKRHASRVLSDAYCKGLVRGQVECCNLRANHVEGQIVAAERFSTTGFVMFPGHVYIRLLELLTPKGSKIEKNQSRLIFSIETGKLKKINRFLLIFEKINREKNNRFLSKKSIDFCPKNQSIFCCVFLSFLLFWICFLLYICAS